LVVKGIGVGTSKGINISLTHKYFSFCGLRSLTVTRM